jgi:hypothetical protein
MSRRFRGRPDANHRELVTFARSLGAVAETIPGDTTSLGRPDVAWGFRGRSGWAEVKTDDGELTAAQQRWHARARMVGLTVDVWRTRDDVLRSLGLTRHVP